MSILLSFISSEDKFLMHLKKMKTCVNIFQATQKLVQEKLIMLRCQVIICLNYLVKIRFHQLKNNIDISKFSPRGRKHYVLYLNNIRMTKQPQKLDFSEDSCGIRNMLKDIVDLLYCNSFSSMGINCRTYNTITTFAYNFLNLIPSCLPILCEELCFQITLSTRKL